MNTEKPHWMIDHELEDARRFREIKDILEAQNVAQEAQRMALKPMLDTYNKSLTIWDFFGLAGKLIIKLGLLLGAITALVALYHSHFK